MKIDSLLTFKIFFLILSIAMLSSCGTKKSAPIINRSKIVYDKKNTLNKNKYLEASSETKSTKDNSNEKNKEIKDGQIIEVSSGDTLYSIAKKYQTPLRDLIEENNLSAPYILKAGTKITIPKPIYYKVKTGDTIYSVSRDHKMNIDNLIAINNLKSPYNITSGQLIKINGENIKKENHEKEDDTNLKEENLNEKNHERNEQNEAITAKQNVIDKTIEYKNNRFSWPIKGQIISKFGPKNGGLYNDGINIKAKEGSAIKASEDGAIAYVGNELKGYGNLIIIKHADGWITAYAHLSKTSAKRGEKVKKGQIIGFSGSTGNVDSPQLYFGLRKGRDAVNPENYLKTS